jgi:hypothetical protein
MNEESELEELTPWLAIVVTLIGGWLRVLHLGAKGMWLDETFSVRPAIVIIAVEF